MEQSSSNQYTEQSQDFVSGSVDNASKSLSLHLTDQRVDIYDKLPSISPRDKLSYVEDKKLWKDLNKFRSDNPKLHILLMEMEVAILKSKPASITHFLSNEFFSDINQLRLREILERKR